MSDYLPRGNVRPSASTRLRALRERAGYSMDEFAKVLGYAGQSSIQRYETEEIANFKYELVERMRPHLVGRGTPPITDNEVTALHGPRFDLHVGSDVASGLFGTGRDLTRLRTEPRLHASLGPMVPLFAQVARLTDDGFVIDHDEPPTPVEAPPQIARIPGSFAIYMIHSTMEPRYFSGETLFIHPRMPVLVGDFVLVTLKLPSRDGFSWVRQLTGRDEKHVHLLRLNPRKVEKEAIADATLQKIVFSGKL